MWTYNPLNGLLFGVLQLNSVRKRSEQKFIRSCTYSVTNRVHVFSPFGNDILVIASSTELFPEDCLPQTTNIGKSNSRSKSCSLILSMMSNTFASRSSWSRDPRDSPTAVQWKCSGYPLASAKAPGVRDIERYRFVVNRWIPQMSCNQGQRSLLV